jgi:transcriptional regulator with XRE-family HTH domain
VSEPTPNQRLRALRHAHGWTQQQAADAVANAVSAQTGKARPTGIDAQWIGRLERGERRWPNAVYRTALRTVYGAETDAELGLYGNKAAHHSSAAPHEAALPTAYAPWLPTAPSGAPHHGTEEADDVHRRELLRTTLAAGGLTIAAPVLGALGQVKSAAAYGPSSERDLVATSAYESASFGQRIGTTNIHPDTLEQINADIERFGRAYLTQPLGGLIAEMRYVRNMVFTALEGRQYPNQARQLYLHAARLCGLMASAASDLGHYDAARTHARTAATCAELAGHPSTTAWIAATQSLIEFWDEQPAEALQRARFGREYVTGDIDALRLHSLEARASARIGDAESTRQAITQMTVIMDRTDASAHRSIFDFPQANALRCAGSSYLWLHEYTSAQTVLSQALDIFEAYPEGGSYAHVAVTRIDLALAHLGTLDLDAASETLRPVLELDSQRRLSGMIRRFDDLRVALAQPACARLPAARDLTEHLNALSPAIDR